MSRVPRQAVLFMDTGKKGADGSSILSRSGSKQKPPQKNLKKKRVDIQTGNFYAANLPDLTKKNEAYLEITIVTDKGNKDPIPFSFKDKIDVRDNSFSERMQANEIITGVEIRGTGFTIECRLTELDKIDENKFNLIKGYIDDNDISGKAEALLNLTGASFNPKEIVKTLFSSIQLIDGLNDDDRLWNENPKLDLRERATVHLFEGWYAFVTRHKRANKKLPSSLYLVNGELYSKYKSEEDNEPFRDSTYLTFQVIADEY